MKSSTIMIGGGALTLAVSLTAKLAGWPTADDLSALFTGLGFVGVVAAFVYEKEKSEDDDKEHTQLLAAMADQAKATRHSAEVQATSALLAAWTMRHSAALQEREAKLARAPHVGISSQWESTCWEACVEYQRKLDELVKRGPV